MHSPRQRTLRAHAKVNLLLRILSREASGYHGIETVFQRLALHDLVHVSLEDDRRTLDCDGPTLPPAGLGTPEQNLAWRAAAAYADATGWDTGWHIAIEKHIPVGGGLGGGSADAAAVLRALNAMSPTPLPPGMLLELAGTLGADVAFLASGASLALAWGRGDRLHVLPPLPPAAVSLVTFAVGVNTGAAYGAIARDREARGDRVAARLYAQDAFASWHAVATIAVNDFERVAPRLHVGVRQALPVVHRLASERRAAGVASIGMLSGSGATCYLLEDAPSTATIDRALLPDDATLVTTTTA